MKKLVMALVAMYSLSTVAEAQITVDLSSYEGKYFTCQHPADFEADDDPVIATLFEAEMDDTHHMQISLNDVAIASAQEFKEWTKNNQKNATVFLGEPTGWKVDEPVIKGMSMTMRRVKEQEINEEKVMMCVYEFAKVSPKSKKLFAGEIHFPLSDESTYKPLIDRIVDSLKEK